MAVEPELIANAIGGSSGAGGISDDIRKRLVLAMMQEGTSGAPVQHWLQGFDRLGKALLSGYELRDLDRSERAHMTALTNMLTGGGGAPGAAPGGGRPPLEPAPRSFGGDQTTAPAPSPSPPFPVTQATENLVPQPDLDTALQVQRQAGADTPEALARREQPLQRPDLVAALGQMREGLGAGQRGAFGQNSLPNSQQDPGVAVPPRPDVAMALAAPQQPAGAMPPRMVPPGLPAPDMRPPTPPAPRADQVAQAQIPPMTPERQRAMVQMLLNPRTPPAAKAMIAQQLNPERKIIESGGEILSIDPRRPNEKPIVLHRTDPKPTDASQDLKEYNANLPAGQPKLNLPQFKALQERLKTTEELRAKSEFGKGEQREGQVRQSTLVVDDLDRAMGIIKTSPGLTTGIGGAILQGVPATQAHNVFKLFEGVRSNVGFQELNRMRQESPTGAALGNVTERELTELQAMHGSLAQSQDDKQLLDNTRRLKNKYLDIIHGPNKGPEREKLQYQQPRQPQQERQGGTVQEGATATNPRTGERMIYRNGRWESVL